MTAPEAGNASLTEGAETHPAQPAVSHDLQMVVQRAKDQLDQLTLQRQEIAQRIAIVKRAIHGLALLGGREVRSGRAPEATRGNRGITNACRLVLNRTDTPLSADQIFAILQEDFLGVFLPTGNHYASLVTTLNRLVNYGEARTFLCNGSRFWQRHQPVGPQPSGSPGT
jgi:hypothetical protein